MIQQFLLQLTNPMVSAILMLLVALLIAELSKPFAAYFYQDEVLTDPKPLEYFIKEWWNLTDKQIAEKRGK